MKRSRAIYTVYVPLAVWFGLIVLWPKSSNILTLQDKTNTPSAREGLYKSSLTKANFGMLGFHLYETNEGKKYWNIKSKFAELHRKDNYAFMQDVDAEFFAQKTGNVVETHSQYGRSLIDRHQVELEGDVEIHSKRGYQFNVEQLNYDGNTHEFHSDNLIHMKGPKIDRPTLFLKGVGLDANIDKEHFFVKKNVAAQKRLKTSEWLRINSRAGEFFTDDQRAIFTGSVQSFLTHLNIRSDVLEISGSEDEEFLLARGNVTLVNKKRVGHADTAFLEVGSNKIILEGRARITSKDNQIQGKRIVLFTDEDRVEVEQAEGKVKN